MVKVYVIEFQVPHVLKKWGLRVGVPLSLVLGGGVAFAALPGGYADGMPLTAEVLTSNFNYVQGEITTPAFGARTPSAFQAYLGAATNIPSNVASTVINFGTVGFDLGGEYDKTTGTFTAKNAGVYSIRCAVFFLLSTPADGAFAVQLIKNGALAASEDLELEPAAAGVDRNVDRLYQLSAGDKIQCGAYQTTSTDQPLLANTDRNDFSAIRLY